MKPLSGVRVLDLTQAYSGPFCTMHLADHGAEVIKIETKLGDQTRYWAPFKNDYSAYYAYMNRNKYGMVLDLKTEEGKHILREMIAKVDVVCENFKVGTLEKLGFSYETMKEINPGIIYASISGFGLEGDYAKRPCYDIVAQAMSGMMSVTGHVDGNCVKIGPSVADSYTGTYLSLGICMALYQRERTGEGQRLDVSMLDTMFSVLESAVVTYTVAGEVPTRMGNCDPGIAPFDSFRAKDGEIVVACGTQKLWESFCGVMGREDLLLDPRFLTNQDRCNHYDVLKPEIEAWTVTKTVVELEKLIVAAEIPFGDIKGIDEITNHPVIRQRNMLWNVYDPGIGENIDMPGTPIKMHGKPDEIQKAAPLLGEDTDRVLEELLGYTKEQITQLHEKKIV